MATRREISVHLSASVAASDISVIIVTMDRPVALRRCVEAILNGSVLPAEIVVVDQSGRDDIEKLLLNLDASIPVIRISQPRRGLSAARNRGIHGSRSPIVAIRDDDCVPGADWV